MSTSEKNYHKPFLDNLYFDFASAPYQNMLKGADFTFEDKENKNDTLFASFRFIKEFASRTKKLNNSELGKPNDKKLSTIERIRIAGLRFINEICDPSHPVHLTLSRLSDDEAKDIDLLLNLLASADKTGQQQFDAATKLIEMCTKMSSNEGNPVERLVYYFSKAICEKINRETGREACDALEKLQMFDLQKALMSVDASVLAFHQKIPLSQVCQFSAIRTILECVGESKHVHVIDLEIRSGMQYIVMMQAIASSRKQIKNLKITAIGTKSESKIKDACYHLAEFAHSMNIQFSFNIVMIRDMLDFSVHSLKLDGHEKVAVYSSVSLSWLIVKPNHLEHLMREIRKINPCVMVIREVEANHTSLTFVKRFIEALFFYGALFDSLSVCMAEDDMNRKVGEAVYYAYAIRNIVAAEGDDRTIRHIGIDVWRAFFARFGMEEIELSDESFNEAKLLIDGFDCKDSCTLRVDGRCFVVSWKEVPIFSVSAWKFV